MCRFSFQLSPKFLSSHSFLPALTCSILRERRPSIFGKIGPSSPLTVFVPSFPPFCVDGNTKSDEDNWMWSYFMFTSHNWDLTSVFWSYVSFPGHAYRVSSQNAVLHGATLYWCQDSLQFCGGLSPLCSSPWFTAFRSSTAFHRRSNLLPRSWSFHNSSNRVSSRGGRSTSYKERLYDRHPEPLLEHLPPVVPKNLQRTLVTVSHLPSARNVVGTPAGVQKSSVAPIGFPISIHIA